MQRGRSHTHNAAYILRKPHRRINPVNLSLSLSVSRRETECGNFFFLAAKHNVVTCMNTLTQ